MDNRLPEQNLVLIAGRVTRDPELRFTQRGQAVAYFDVAVNRRVKDPATGEWKDDTVFVPVSVWGPVAERCKEKLKKGGAVHVEGRLAAAEFTDKSGVKRKSMKVAARRVQFLSREAAGGEEGEAHGSEERHPEGEHRSDVSGIEDVPF